MLRRAAAATAEDGDNDPMTALPPPPRGPLPPASPRSMLAEHAGLNDARGTGSAGPTLPPAV
eukprot:scaffold28258_cov65-Phaeocystis_antarctica.AAC.4